MKEQGLNKERLGYTVIMKKRISIMLALMLCIGTPCNINAYADNTSSYEAEENKKTGYEFEYEELGDGTISIIGFYSYDEGAAVTIPSEIDGKKVSSIGFNAFADCTEVKSVTFPSTVKTIDDWAFAGCTGITAVELPANLETIGESAFEGCSSLDRIIFGTKLTVIGENAFAGCTSLKYVYYKAFKTGWSKIAVAEGNENLTDLKVNYKPTTAVMTEITANEKGFTVNWNKKSGITGYQIKYSDNEDFKGAKYVTISGKANTSKAVTPAGASGEYYVKIRTYRTSKINGKYVRIYSYWSKAQTVTIE